MMRRLVIATLPAAFAVGQADTALAHVIGNRININGINFNGTRVNGIDARGQGTQGVSTNGAAEAVVISIELPSSRAR